MKIKTLLFACVIACLPMLTSCDGGVPVSQTDFEVQTEIGVYKGADALYLFDGLKGQISFSELSSSNSSRIQNPSQGLACNVENLPKASPTPGDMLDLSITVIGIKDEIEGEYNMEVLKMVDNKIWLYSKAGGFGIIIQNY